MTEVASLLFISPAAGATSAIASRRLTELAPEFLTPEFLAPEFLAPEFLAPEFLAAEFAGLRMLWVGVQPPLTFFMARKDVASLADLKGLKIRFQGEQHAKVVRALGP